MGSNHFKEWTDLALGRLHSHAAATIEQPESVPDTAEPEPIAEPEPEPSPYLAGWIYLLDVEDTVIYSHEEPSAQLRAAYYDMMNMWNRQERDGHPFRVVEGTQ